MKMNGLFERLSVSLLDDFSYSLNDSPKFQEMVTSAKGLPQARHQGILRITDPDKRSASFVIEKMKAVAGTFKQNSENDNARIVRMIECPLDYDSKTVDSSKLMVYLWKDSLEEMNYLLRVYNQWLPSEQKSRNFWMPAPRNPNLLDLVSRLEIWQENALHEYYIRTDIDKHFPVLKRTSSPIVNLPVDDIYKPIVIYEGIMQYASERDKSGKPVPYIASPSISAISPKVYKNAAASVQLYGDGSGKTTWVTIAFRNI